MPENKESNNTGCIVGTVLFVIGNLVYFFTTESSESIAETGGVLLAIAGFAIAWFVCKALFTNKSYDSDSSKTNSPTQTSQTTSNDNPNKSPWGCILTGLACVVITVIIVGSITSSFSFNYAVGIAFAIILAIVFGLIIYSSFKE